MEKKVSGYYGWPHLNPSEERTKLLFQLIEPHLKGGDKVLDIMCGFSPLAGPLLKRGFKIVGFDSSDTAINYLKKYYPRGKWIHKNVEKYYDEDPFRGFTVVFLIGAGPPQNESSFQKFLNRLLDTNRTRIVLVETRHARGYSESPPWIIAYNTHIQSLPKLGYVILEQGTYPWAGGRLYTILRRNENE